MMERARFLARGCLVALGMAMAAGSAVAEEQDPAAGLTTERIEAIVRDYLLREPEVIYQALQELQRRQTAAATERQRQAIIENRAALLHDPATPVAGDPDGDVTLVEFFDYRCMYCRRVVSSVRALIEDDSDLRVVFKELPVLGEDSVRAARAALAAQRQDPDSYVPFHFALMQAEDLSEGAILELAEDFGLDSEELARRMYSDEIESMIEANYALANELGIEGTPAFVIGDKLIPGAVDQARLRELIEEARASG